MYCHDQVQDLVLPSWEVHCLFEVGLVYYVKDGLIKYTWVPATLYAEGRPVNVWAVKIATDNQHVSFGLPLQSLKLLLGRRQVHVMKILEERGL